MADVRLTWDERELAALVRDESLRRELLASGGQIAAAAAADAPRRTGAGAASIHPEAVFEDAAWTVRVGWDQLHYYMRFHDLGTRYVPAQHFLEHALDRYARP